MKDTLSQLGTEGTELSTDQSAWDECFAEFDKDGNGTISRGEMAHFIKKLLDG